ncbi:hypothetical protein ACQKPX_00965 [Photobacterium sp. DNB23_23_1]
MFLKWLRSYFISLLFTLGLISLGASATPTICGEPTEVTLFAGQTIDAGTVTISNDENNLYVTFSTANDWLLKTTHLHVSTSLAGIPTNKKGNPKIGNFDYQTEHSPYATTFTYTILKTDLNLGSNNSLVIAAHAEVVKINENNEVIESETGWGDGKPFVDRGSWATYIEYTWQDCNSNPPTTKTETAFAYGANLAKCFLDITDEESNFNRWGWTNGPLTEGTYYFDIYAAAGQCDLSKGTKVGTLTVDYDGSQAKVTYQMTETDGATGMPYTLTETQLYVGGEILPRNEGDFTVAPGQYPENDSPHSNILFYQYTITGLSGGIYVVAHATVDGFPASD